MAPRFLMVEDNQADVALMSEALDETAVTHDIDVAPDGEEAMDFLQRRGRHANAPRPDMILLDLNLPRLNGREVLERIKQDPALRQIPVVVLTGSSARGDVQAAYDLHANCYIVKPADLDTLKAVVKTIETFWFSMVKLPPGEK